MMPKDCKKLMGVRIARVSTVRYFIDTQLHTQISAIVQAGAKVIVVASEDKLDRPIPGSQYIPIEIPRKINLFKDAFALIRLWLLFRREKFKIVHSTTPKAGLLCAIAAKLAGVPIRLHTFTGQPWVGLIGIKKFLSKNSDKLIAVLNTHCYADSISQKNFIISQGIVPSKKISVLGSGSLAGIDLERFNPLRFNDSDKIRLRAELGIPLASQVCLFVGRLSQDKGIVELLQAYQNVIDNENDAYLILLGPSEIDVDALLNFLSDTVRERVVILGFSNEPERFMAIADILILPSYREGFGTVVIEAAAMGVPTIGTNIYGLSDAIVDGETGLLVTVRDVEGLTTAINLLLKDPVLRLKIGANAQSRVENEFSDKRMSELISNEYTRFL